MLLFLYLFNLMAAAFLQTTTQTWSPDRIRWQQVNPDGSKYAVLEGDRDKAGEPFTYAFFLPDGVWVGPHTHSQDARVAVVSGTLLLGEGARMNGDPQPLPAGTFFVVRRNVPHWEGARGNTLIIGVGHGVWTTTTVPK
jgi:quercetin dioxygenase-like cupin family protein